MAGAAGVGAGTSLSAVGGAGVATGVGEGDDPFVDDAAAAGVGADLSGDDATTMGGVVRLSTLFLVEESTFASTIEHPFDSNLLTGVLQKRKIES